LLATALRTLIPSYLLLFCLLCFPAPPTPHIYTLSLHDALPIYGNSNCESSTHTTAQTGVGGNAVATGPRAGRKHDYADRPCARRSEEHTSELQSRVDLVCRLLLEKKKKKNRHAATTHTYTSQKQ